MTIEVVTETQKVYINVIGMRTAEQTRELADELVLAAREVERKAKQNSTAVQEVVSELTGKKA